MTERCDYRTLFVIGCPRSGTTWMQLLLARHPAVATAPESQIFAYYLEHFRRQWRHEHEGPGREYQGRAGLSRVLSPEEFDELCRRTARYVLDKIAAGRPDAGIVIEKSPKHALQAEFIRRQFPDAYFLHVVRDPRDTVASLLAAGRGWGRGWAPKNVIDAARMWNAHIERARRIGDDDPRYREVRYEALKDDAAGELHAVLDWLDIPEDRSFCDEAAEACRIGRLRSRAEREGLPVPGERSPEGFFRKGAVGGWQDDLTRAEVRIIEHICRDAMDASGYRPLQSGGRRRPLRIGLHVALQRVRESIDWQLERLLYRI